MGLFVFLPVIRIPFFCKVSKIGHAKSSSYLSHFRPLNRSKLGARRWGSTADACVHAGLGGGSGDADQGGPGVLLPGGHNLLVATFFKVIAFHGKMICFRDKTFYDKFVVFFGVSLKHRELVTHVHQESVTTIWVVMLQVAPDEGDFLTWFVDQFCFVRRPSGTWVCAGAVMTKGNPLQQ